MLRSTLQMILLICAVLCFACYVSQAQTTGSGIPLSENSRFIRVVAIVGSGLTIEHTVKDLFLTETRANRASYLIEITSLTSSTHTISAIGNSTVILCDNRFENYAAKEANRFKLCAINLYLQNAVYQIVLSEI
jgi:hypothetical protein